MKERVLALLEGAGPKSMEELSRLMDIHSSKDFTSLVKTVAQLESQEEVRFTKKGQIALPQRASQEEIRLTGIFRAHKNGFGFVTIDADEDDLFIGRNDVHQAIDGDTVSVVITKVADQGKGTAAEARVVEILDHALTSAVGLLILDEEKPKYVGYLQSKNQKIRQRIYVKKTPLVLDGTEIVKVEIEQYPSKKHDYFVANLREVVGHKDDAGIDVLQVLESMEISSTFPEEVLEEANRIPDAPTAADMEGRRDLRDLITFTIDGADAKDLDDAVHIQELPNGNLELGVHIADVSYYVQEGSALDREALSRGTSVYVTDRVVPMLPERLSNGICSLNPQVDRLTQSAIMEISPEGRVVNHWIGQTVIKTTFRMTYSRVNEMLAGDEEALAEYEAIVPSVRAMAKLHENLEQMRIRRGALNFDTQEAKILVNEKGLPVDIVLRQRGTAERMIESFMLIANETVAEHFARLNLPFIYRIHEEPKAEKLQKFIDYASTFGLPLYGTASSMTSEALQQLMARVKDEPYADVLNMMLLRSMQQARYSEENTGHYGLGADYYTHFTSPIRRYPDLLVHRMVREYGHLTEEKIAHFDQAIPEIAKETSRLERRAIDAEREVEAMKKAEFMADFVGEEFDGVVSSVVKFGLFVELPNTVEGLIHVTNLPEFYHYNERTMTLQGEKSGTVFRVGQAIRIRLVRADKETGEIDFEYLPSEADVIEPITKGGRRKDRKQDRDTRGQNGRNRDASGSRKGRERSTKDYPSSSRKKKSRKKGDKPFYKDVAKKGGKHGKGRRKGRRTK